MRKAKSAAGSPNDWVERVARIGYATKGAVYAVIGVLAIKAAVGDGGSVGGGGNAAETIGSQPFGKAMLVILAIGLFFYAIWRFIQAALDPENAGSDKSGAVKRTGYAISGLMHVFLGITAVQIVMGSGGGGSSKKTWLAKLMAIETVGPILVGIGGAAVLAYAGYQIYKGWTMKFKEELKTGEMSTSEERGATLAGRIGLVARGIVFGIVGVYLVKSAISTDPSQAKGVGGALQEIASQSYGMILLILIAAGLVAYAVLQFVLAKYRRIPA